MITLNDIKNAVSDAAGIDINEKTRKVEYIICRNIYYEIAYRYTANDYEAIGELLNKDRTTVYHGLGNVKADLQLEKYNRIYCKALDLLNISYDKPELKENVRDKHTYIPNESELIQDALSDLKQFDDEILLEFIETRLKPFKTALKSRVHRKVITEVSGAMLNR